MSKDETLAEYDVRRQREAAIELRMAVDDMHMFIENPGDYDPVVEAQLIMVRATRALNKYLNCVSNTVDDTIKAIDKLG